MSKAYDGRRYCDGCNKAKEGMIECYWASGNKDYCKECWPRYRNFYEDEAGQSAWVREGDYFAPRSPRSPMTHSRSA